MMKVELVQPYGYCQGVIQAIEKAKMARKQFPSTPITILGMLVHNEHVLNDLKSLQIESLYDEKKDLSTLLKEIKEGIVIFTAHGHDARLEEQAQKQGLQIIDATCPRVKANHLAILRALKEGKQAIFIGKKGHPETVATLSFSPSIYFYDIQDGFLTSSLPNKDKPIVIFNQTTLSILELQAIYAKLRENYDFSFFIQDEICAATRLRQEALLHLKEKPEAIFIVGDPRSNNTEALRKIALEHYPKTAVFKMRDISDLEPHMMQFSSIALVSGASTPNEITETIYHHLTQVAEKKS